MTIRLALKRVYTFPVENPVASDNIPRHKVPRSFVVEKIVALKFNGVGTFDWELRFSADANDANIGAGTLIHSDAGVSNTTTGVTYTPPGDFAAVTIPTDSWVWMVIPAVTGGINRPGMVLVQMTGVEKGA